MKLKHVIISGLVLVITAFGIVQITQATLQTIADIPPQKMEKRMQIRLKLHNLIPDHAYTVQFAGNEKRVLYSDKSGMINDLVFVPQSWEKNKIISFSLSPNLTDTTKTIPYEIGAEIDFAEQILVWKGHLHDKSVISPEDVTEHYTAHTTTPLSSRVAPDWSGKYTQKVNLPDTFSPGTDICMNVKGTDIEMCLSLNIYRPAEVVDALIPSPFNLFYSAVSEDPISVFDVWISPLDCEPYDVKLSTCYDQHMSKLFEQLWKKPIYDMQRMTLQVSSMMMQQVGFIGTLIDAKIQLETQLLFWEKQEEAHDKYHPSEQICTLATLSKGLASSEAKHKLNTFALSKVFYFDDSNIHNSTNQAGNRWEKEIRFWDFTGRYCNPQDMTELLGVNISGLAPLCQSLTHGDIGRVNRDMDYTRLVETPLTLEVDITDGENSSPDEEDVFTMAKYLYGHKTPNFPQVDPETAKDIFRDPDIFTHKYQQYRSISAIRNVARYSFANIIGMKSSGSGMTNDYIIELFKLFGMEDPDIERFIGKNPSYYAQMNVITRNIFQHPRFYTDLIDKPANVARFDTTMQALTLMHKRDQFEAQLRKEMLLSLLVEMELRELQDTEINKKLKLMGFGRR
jgi:hypothetical protein